jgi:hypothetical protein
MDYCKYYREQAGSGVSAFQGARYQRGSGLGNVFKKFYRWLLPVFKTHALPVLTNGAKSLSKEAIQTAANIATDTLNDVNLMSAVQNRSTEAINNFKHKYLRQEGRGGIKRKKQQFKSFKNKSKRNKYHDIFN